MTEDVVCSSLLYFYNCTEFLYSHDKNNILNLTIEIGDVYIDLYGFELPHTNMFTLHFSESLKTTSFSSLKHSIS